MRKKRNDLTKAGHEDRPASVGLVKKVRDELRADIAGLAHELKSVEHRMGSKFAHVEGKFGNVEAKFENVEAKIEKVEAKIEKVLASTHRTEVLMEEQRSENRIVMDAFQQITAQYHRIEERLLQRS